MNYTISTRKPSIFSFLSVTFILIFLNVATFLLFAILTAYNVLPVEVIAIKPANILQGDYLWTPITSMFMHAGFFHLFVNMMSLLFVGGFIEKIIGRKRYFWFYMISGLAAGAFFVLVAMLTGADIDTFAVGASGAIFGLAGLMMVLTPNIPLYVMFIPIPIKAKYAIPGLLLIMWFISIAAEIPIGNTAHLGGLLVGLAYGIYLRKKYPKKVQHISRIFS